jgi:hypothetical protein
MIVPHQIRMRIAPVAIQHTRGHIRVAFKTVAVLRLRHAAGKLALLIQDLFKNYLVLPSWLP